MSNQINISGICGCCDGAGAVTPLAISNAPGMDAIAYRAGTHSAFFKSMLKALAEKPALARLTTRDTGDPSVALIDAWAMVLDIITFYQERIINEGYLRTATERRSVLELARHIGYELNPGVAASAYLAFFMETAQGAPESAVVPVGTKAQSIPGQDQLPQVFETVEELGASTRCNILKPVTAVRKIPGFGDRELYLQGIMTGLKPGDAILMIGAERAADEASDRWDFRRVREVIEDKDAGLTRVTWEEGLGWRIYNRVSLPASKQFKLFALRKKAGLFGFNAPDWRMMPEQVKTNYLPEKKELSDYANWPGFTIREITGATGKEKHGTIYLDALHSGIVEKSWLVLSAEHPRNYCEVYQVAETAETSCTNFTLTSKITALKLKGENLWKKFDNSIRETVVYAQSEPLDIAESPVKEPVMGKTIVLGTVVTGLSEGKTMIVSGKRTRISFRGTQKAISLDDPAMIIRIGPEEDSVLAYAPVDQRENPSEKKWVVTRDIACEGGNVTFTGYVVCREDEVTYVHPGAGDEVVSEVVILDSLDAEDDTHSKLVLKEPMRYVFHRTSVEIYGNIARATHGETRNEVLGSGNGSASFQHFELKQKPLTYVTAATASGTVSTLQIRVNDLLWKEVPTLFGCAPADRVYTTRIADDGKVTVRFGDGITGSRLPTGSDNIRATFRVGTGLDGMVDAAQISQLMSRPLGVKNVVNPLRPDGADDPEKMDAARRNAPSTVLTFGRIVSVRDFGDFANAFTGIGKARADLFMKDEENIVFVTIASADGKQVEESSGLYQNLLKAINAARHPFYSAQVGSYRPKTFTLEANIVVDPSYTDSIVMQDAADALKSAFSFSGRQFGQGVSPAEVIAVIQAVPGVVAVDLDKLNGIDHVLKEHFFLKSEMAHWDGSEFLPAELLTINPQGIKIRKIHSLKP